VKSEITTSPAGVSAGRWGTSSLSVAVLGDSASCTPVARATATSAVAPVWFTTRMRPPGSTVTPSGLRNKLPHSGALRDRIDCSSVTGSTRTSAPKSCVQLMTVVPSLKSP
jgi:hypothetical protein